MALKSEKPFVKALNFRPTVKTRATGLVKLTRKVCVFIIALQNKLISSVIIAVNEPKPELSPGRLVVLIETKGRRRAE